MLEPILHFGNMYSVWPPVTGPFDKQGLAATLTQYCPQMTQNPIHVHTVTNSVGMLCTDD